MYNCESNWQATFNTDNAAITSPSGGDTSATTTSTSSSSSSVAPVTVTATEPAPTATNPPAGTKSDAAAIAGGVVGGIAGLGLIALAILYGVLRYRRSKKTAVEANGSAPMSNSHAHAEPYKAAAAPQAQSFYGSPGYPPAEMQASVPGWSPYGHQELAAAPMSPAEMPGSPKPR
jgi:hypothetical protein